MGPIKLIKLITNMPLLSIYHSKLGVPIKTVVSATVLEEAINGTVTIQPLALGKPVSRKVAYRLTALPVYSFIEIVIFYMKSFIFLIGREAMCPFLFR